ncbi:hypothetical protein [Pseudomonas sp. dw_358]|uniref:hypothetical protein n=1 Tax=Pseudomonas sp. dw_358 TaxID=2720083 RepID=UPI001BD2C101|nr:hypothetical protein [Pseudomonas sp. dw_358]
MKLHWAVAVCLIVAGCSSGGGGSVDGRPIEITGLQASYDSSSDSVDLAINFVNISRQPLRQIQIQVQAYDSGGNPVKGGGPRGAAVVTLYGPYDAGIKVGPLVDHHLWTGSDVHCLEVVDVSVSGMDYASSNFSGAAANALVASDTRRSCKGS